MAAPERPSELSVRAAKRLDTLARAGDETAADVMDAVTKAVTAHLDALANAGDDTAAAVISTVTRGGAGPDGMATVDRRTLLPYVLAEIAKPVDRALEPIRDFLTEGADLDEIVTENIDLIKHAQAYFDDNGVAILTALFHASLPEAYLGQRGVQALDLTGELFRNWTRRIQETGQFLVNVLSPTPDLWQLKRTSLHSGEFGARAARRVRLTHAAIRWMLLDTTEIGLASLRRRSEDEPPPTVWDARLRTIGLEGRDQPPLNQQDLLATLGTFTTVVLRALERLGVAPTKKDREAFHFLWNVVGWHLGIGDERSFEQVGINRRTQAWTGNRQLPMNTIDMDAAYDYLAEQLQHPSDAGRRMAKALMQELAYPLPQPLQRAPAFVARYLIGAEHANWLDIEEGGYVELVLNDRRVIERWTARARTRAVGRASIGLLSRRVTRYALRAFITQARWSERGLTIDPRIASKWGIQIPPDPRDAALDGPPRRARTTPTR